MEINNLQVMGDFVEILDNNSAHIHLGGCIRLVHLQDTEFETIQELETAIINLIL